MTPESVAEIFAAAETAVVDALRVVVRHTMTIYHRCPTACEAVLCAVFGEFLGQEIDPKYVHLFVTYLTTT